jgi:hypothetical protein
MAQSSSSAHKYARTQGVKNARVVVIKEHANFSHRTDLMVFLIEMSRRSTEILIILLATIAEHTNLLA